MNFTSVEQFIGKNQDGNGTRSFAFGIGTSDTSSFGFRFRRGRSEPVLLKRMDVKSGTRNISYENPAKMTRELSDFLQTSKFKDAAELMEGTKVVRSRFLFVLENDFGNGHVQTSSLIGHELDRLIVETIHVPGLRGNPQRNYPISAVGERFPGTFEKYAASVLTSASRKMLETVGTDLAELGLTWKVAASRVDDTQVELKVGRLPRPVRGGMHDLVSIADVGFGVSQTLPVVVALLAAKPGQFVYIEQPEIHLHPRAQVAMAGLLVRAANRGVQVVIETHSSLLLLGIQRLVASGELDTSKVLLHWFERDKETGLTAVTTREFDEAGRFGDWPEDFDDVTLEAQQSYLDAAESRLAQK